jgi:hypothetical protein
MYLRGIVCGRYEISIDSTRDEHMCSVFLLGMNTCAPYSHLGWTHLLRILTWDEHTYSVVPTWDEHMCSVFSSVRIAHSSVFCAVFCQSLFVLLSFSAHYCSFLCIVYSWYPLIVSLKMEIRSRILTWDEHTYSVVPTWDEHMCSVFPLGMNTRVPYSHLGWIHVLRIPTWDEHMCSVFPFPRIQWGGIRNRQYFY